MSADAWRVCPKCKAKAEAEKEKLIAKVEKSYGKLPKDEYIELVKESEKEIELNDTMREDYEIYINEDGFFTVDFRASCDCGFRFEFKEEKQVNLK